MEYFIGYVIGSLVTYYFMKSDISYPSKIIPKRMGNKRKPLVRDDLYGWKKEQNFVNDNISE